MPRLPAPKKKLKGGKRQALGSKSASQTTTWLVYAAGSQASQASAFPDSRRASRRQRQHAQQHDQRLGWQHQRVGKQERGETS